MPLIYNDDEILESIERDIYPDNPTAPYTKYIKDTTAENVEESKMTMIHIFFNNVTLMSYLILAFWSMGYAEKTIA